MSLVRLSPFRVYVVLLLLIVGVALMPLVGALTAAAIASAAGCRLDEGGSYPCIVMGSDIGGTLSTLFVLGWLMLLTVPAGGLLFLAWGVALIVHIIRRKANRL